MRPSEKIAEKISEILENDDLFKKIDVFGWMIKDSIDEKYIIEEQELSEFEAHIQDIIKDIGLSSYWYKQGSIPFKLSLFSESDTITLDGFYPLFSGITEDQGKINEMSFHCLKMFTDLFQKKSLFIIDNEIKIPEPFKKIKIPIVKIRNLEKVDDEEEFIELIQDS
jgi:predicted transcriptional regulator